MVGQPFKFVVDMNIMLLIQSTVFLVGQPFKFMVHVNAMLLVNITSLLAPFRWSGTQFSI